MKDKYIIKLAKTNKTIIIPDLGAIVVTQNENVPFIFNEFLKFNDGVLQTYISNKEEISKEEAKLIIEKFVQSVLSELESKSVFDFGKVGFFIKKDSKLSLVKELKGSSDNIEDKKSNEIKNEIKEEKAIEIDDSNIKNSISHDIEDNIEKKVVVNVEENEYINKKTNMTENINNPEKKKKNKSLTVLVVVLIIWLIIMILGYLNFDKIFPNNDIIKTKVQIEETLIDKDTIIEESVVEELVFPVSKDDLRLISGKYYIIAGVFSSYDNAEALLSHVNDFYEVSSAEYSGVKDGNYVVSFEVFDDKQIALEKLLEYRQIEPKAWLHHAK